MDQLFDKMKGAHKNTANDLTDWMEKAKVIDNNKVKKDDVKKMFTESARNQNDVQLTEFMKVRSLATDNIKILSNVAEMKGISVDEIYQMLAGCCGPSVLATPTGAGTMKAVAGRILTKVAGMKRISVDEICKILVECGPSVLATPAGAGALKAVAGKFGFK